MNRRVKIIKCAFCFSLILLLSLNSLAAIVSDNDGSAFVTKAEFDSLKKNFNVQIEQYNKSIDGKIDGAIASYLSGIKMTNMINVRSLIPDTISVTGSSNNKLYWSGKTDYVLNSTEEYVPKMVGVWNIPYYNQYSDTARIDGMVQEQIVTHRRDKDMYVPITWLSGNNVTQVSNTQAIITFYAQLAYRQESASWGIDDSNFGMVNGWNNGKTLGEPIFAASFAGPLDSSTAHHYNNFWYSYNYLYNVNIEVDSNESAINFNVAPLGVADEYTKNANSNSYDFYWQQINVNNDTHLLQPDTGTVADNTVNYYKKDKYVGWSKTGAISGVWESKLRLWNKVKPREFIWPFLTAVDSENKEIKKGIKLCEIDKNGDLSIDIKCSKNGYIVIYNANTPDTYWTDKTLGKTRTSETDTSWKSKPNCYQVVANTTKRISLSSVKKDDKLWVLYLPGGFTGSGGTWVGVDDGVIDSCDITLIVEN